MKIDFIFCFFAFLIVASLSVVFYVKSQEEVPMIVNVRFPYEDKTILVVTQEDKKEEQDYIPLIEGNDEFLALAEKYKQSWLKKIYEQKRLGRGAALGRNERCREKGRGNT